MNKLDIDSNTIKEIVTVFEEQCTDKAFIKESELYTAFTRDREGFDMYGRYPLVLVNKEIVQLYLSRLTLKIKKHSICNFVEDYFLMMKDALSLTLLQNNLPIMSSSFFC